MRRPDLALAVFLSLALHATLFLVFSSYQEAQVRFEPGVSAVTLNIMPSVASRAAAPPPQPKAPPPPPVVEKPRPPEPKPQPKPVVQPPAPPPTPEPEPIPIPPVPPPEPPPVVKQSAPVTPAPQPQPAARKPAAPAPKAPPARETPSKEASATPAKTAAAVNSVDANADTRPHGVSSPAVAVGLTQPQYPFYSRRHGEEGTVVVEVQILSTDRAGRIEVVQSSGYSRLDRAAVDALKKADYKAARRAGVPVTTTKRFSFTFRLEGTEVQ